MSARSGSVFSTTASLSAKFVDGRGPKVIRQACTLVHGSAYFQLGQSIPANARVLWARLISSTTVPVTNGIGTAATDTGAAGYGLIMVPTTASEPVTSPPGTTSNALNTTPTVGAMLAFNLSTASSITARHTPVVENYRHWLTNNYPAINTYTVPAALFILPVQSVVSNGWAFNGSGTVTAHGTYPGGVFGTSSTAATSTVTYTVNVELYYEDYKEYT